jgi:ribosome-binding protein aMBF1 (putative translation factor)
MDGLPNHNTGQPPQGQASMNGAPLNTQMMNFVGDPALAAAAAAASLFPNPAMFSNPSAFFAIPQMVVPPGMQAAATSKTAAASGGVAAKPVAASHQSVPMGFNVNSLQQPSGPSNGWAQPMCMTSGGFQGAMVPIQTGDPTNLGLPTANTSSAMQVHLAAAAAAAAAVPNIAPSAGVTSDTSSYKMDNLTSGEKAKQNRERNREHARSTRLRKKAYVQKLKELVEGLHAERTDEVRKRRIAMQHLAEKQNVRRAVVRSFLRFHSNYESDPQKWITILEDDFWLKQPVTPYRAFRRDEIKQVRPSVLLKQKYASVGNARLALTYFAFLYFVF